jgi:hypothetical protein
MRIHLRFVLATIFAAAPLDNAKPLPPNDVADVMAYLLSRNQMPARPASTLSL